MNYFKVFSIRKKLVVITMISIIISLVISGSMMITYSMKSNKESGINRLQVLSSIIGDRSKAALVFNDESQINSNLQSLSYEPTILFACIYTANNELIGQYQKNATQNITCRNTAQPKKPDNSTHYYDNAGNIYVHQEIILSGDIVGEVVIYLDTAILEQSAIKNSAIIIAIIVLGITIAYLMIEKLQVYISGPIRRLSNVAKNISENHDYKIRAEKESEDETGLLVDTFNEMLSTINQKNREIMAVRDNYLALYDKNPMMLFTLNHDGIILSTNEYVSELFNSSSSDLIGKSIKEIALNDDIDTIEELITKCRVNPNRVHKCDFRFLDIHKKIIWIRSTTRNITENDGSKNILFVCEDITETHTLTEKLSYQASHDTLTGLINRREFEHRISLALKNSKTLGQQHALFFIDLDQFKVINDTCGHLAGDHLLRELVSTLNPVIRKNDTLARLGGDEFGVLLENCALKKASEVADLILSKINSFKFRWENTSFAVGASIGVVPFDQHSSSITILMTDADAACYIAKRQGRNRIHIYSPGDKDIATHHGEMNWVNRIQEALNNDDFTLMAQSITRTGESTQHDYSHYEILTRMIDKDGTLISPEHFLGIAERYNLSPAFDRWVIKNTFGWLQRNQKHLEKLEVCSINLSGNTLSDESFSGYLLNQFETYNIPAEKICFEITETAAIANLDIAQQFIHSFRSNLQCKFSLDDFGSGLSSYAYLRNLPVDFLKIDGLFIRDITSDPISLAMVRSINEIGKIMGKQTIAEFVENEETLNQLKILDVDYAQGYFISEPVFLDDIVK